MMGLIKQIYFGALTRLSALTVLALIVVFAVMPGCSMKSSSAKVTIPMPDWNAMRAKDVARQSKVSTLAVDYGTIDMLFINISGGNMVPQFDSFQRPQGDANWSPPNVVSFNSVPEGDRLVQVLAVFKSGTGMAFYYGDRTQKITGTNVSISLTLSNVATAGNVTEGEMMGRFMGFDANDPTPTGIIQYRFEPGPGKPSMIVSEGEIFGGWANLFTLSTPLISYSINGNRILRGAYAGSASLQDPTKPNSSMRIHIPAGFKIWDWGNGQKSDPDPKGATDLIVGYFGPLVNGSKQRVCYPTTSASVDSYYTDSAGTTQVTWNGGSKTLATDAYVDTTSAARGVGLASGSTCAGTEFTDFLNVNPKMLSEDAPMDVRIPFVAVSPSTATNQATYIKLSHYPNLDQVTVNWSYLPGAGDELDGAGVFYRVVDSNYSNDDDIRDNGGYLCNDLADMKFDEVDVDGAATTATLDGVTATDFANIQVVVCPLNADTGEFFSSAVAQRNGQNGGQQTLFADHLAAFSVDEIEPTSGAPTVFDELTCTPIYIEAQDVNGNLASISDAGQNVVISSQSANANLAWDPNCSGAYPSLSIPMFNGRYTVYAMLTTATTDDWDIVYSGASLASTTFYGDATGGFNTAADGDLIMPDPIQQYECVDAKLVLSNGGVLSAASGSGNLNVAGSDWLFYYDYDQDCNSTPFPGGSFAGNKAVQGLRVRYIGTSPLTAAAAKTVNVSVATLPVTPHDSTVTVTPPPKATQLSIMSLPKSMNVGSCYKFDVGLFDSSGNRTAVQSSYLSSGVNMTLSSTSSNGSFYMDGACVTPLTGSMISQYNSKSVMGSMYFKPTSMSSAATVTVSATNLAGGVTIANGVMSNITIGPAVASKFLEVWPGQTFTNCSGVSGTAQTPVLDIPFPVQLYAVTSGNCLADGSGSTTVPYNQGPYTIGSSSAAGYLSIFGGPVTFANGVANIYLRFNAQSVGGPVGPYLYLIGANPLPNAGGEPYLMATFDLPATQISVDGPTTITAGVCQPLSITFRDAFGNPRRLNEVHTFTFSTNQSSGSYYLGLDPNCSGSGPYGPFINNGANGLMTINQPLYLKMSSATSFTLTITDNTTGGFALTTLNLGMSSTGSSTGYATNLKVFAPVNGKVGQCIPMMIETTDSSGQALPSVNSSQSFVIDDNGAGGAFNQWWTCEGTAPTLSVDSTHRATLLYYKPAVANASTQIRVSDLSMVLTMGTTTINVTNP